MEAQTACCLIVALSNIKVPFQVLLSISSLIHHNRNNIVRMAFKEGCSHLLFVDSDMVFDHDAIQRLLDRDLDIVAGRYNKKVAPIVSTVPDIWGLSSVPFVPAGFLLINMEVFKKIGEPYFSFEGAESEDAYFCQKAIKNGYEVWCDPTIKIGHLGSSIF